MNKEINSFYSVTDFQQTEWWWRCWQTSTKRWSRRIRTELHLLVHTHVECSLVSKKDPQYCVVAFRISLKKLMFFKIYCNDEWRDVTLHCDGDQGNWHRHCSGISGSLVCYCVGQVWQGGNVAPGPRQSTAMWRQASPAVPGLKSQPQQPQHSTLPSVTPRGLTKRSHQEHDLVLVSPSSVRAILLFSFHLDTLPWKLFTLRKMQLLVFELRNKSFECNGIK